MAFGSYIKFIEMKLIFTPNRFVSLSEHQVTTLTDSLLLESTVCHERSTAHIN